MTEDKNKEQELKENVQEQTPETNIESETAADTAEAEAEEKDPLAEAQEQVAALNDKYLRLAACAERGMPFHGLIFTHVFTY